MKKLLGIAAMAIMAVGAGAAFAPADAHGIEKDLGDTIIVVGDGHTGVYNDDNGCDGFQGHPGDCDDDGDEEPADTKVA